MLDDDDDSPCSWCGMPGPLQTIVMPRVLDRDWNTESKPYDLCGVCAAIVPTIWVDSVERKGAWNEADTVRAVCVATNLILDALERR